MYLQQNNLFKVLVVMLHLPHVRNCNKKSL